jgi:diguanylate cyclase (GGDEF)-like protein
MNVMAAGSMSWRLLSGAVVVLLVGLLAASIVEDVRFASERIGVYIGENDDGLTVEAVEPGLPADLAGAQPGDIIKSVNQEPTPDPDSLSEAFDRFHQPGQSLHVVVLRDGAEVELSVTPGAPPDLARMLAQLVLVAAYFGLALLAAQHRNEDLRARLLMIFVALVAIEMALPDGTSFSTGVAVLIGLAWIAMTGAQIAVELHLVSLIPRRLPLLKRYALVVKAFYMLGILIIAGLAGIALYNWRAYGDLYSETWVQAQGAVLTGWAIVVPAILVRQAWKARNARERNQAMLVLIGLVPWVIYIILPTFWAGWIEVDIRWIIHAENFVLLFFPAAVFVAIFRYGLFDIEQLVRRGLVYSVVAALIIILLYMLLTTALNWFTGTLGEDVGLWLVTGIAVASGILFRPLRHGIERLVERGLFPERRALRKRLIEIAGSLSDDQSNMHEMLNRLASQAQETLGLGWTAVVAIEQQHRQAQAAFSGGLDDRRRQDLVRLLSTESTVFAHLSRNQRPVAIRRLKRHLPDESRALERIGAEVLVPLFFQRRMIGILCLSSKQTGELFVREELELLNLFSHQVAASFENLRLFQDATYEELTGLLRREAVLRQLQAECSRSIRNARPISVFMIDLDHFKSVNDTHGHLFGDLILQRVAEVMHERIRAVDSLGRYGGEEFLLVLPDTDTEGAVRLAVKLRRAVFDLEFVAPDGETAVRVTISIGVSSSSSLQTDPETLANELIGQADAAVYAAKRSGRNRIVTHEEALELKSSSDDPST